MKGPVEHRFTQQFQILVLLSLLNPLKPHISPVILVFSHLPSVIQGSNLSAVTALSHVFTDLPPPQHVPPTLSHHHFFILLSSSMSIT